VTTLVRPLVSGSNSPDFCGYMQLLSCISGVHTGVVTAWEPPHRLAYRWHIATAPSEATDVEIRFRGTSSGATEVAIEHSGWDRLGIDAYVGGTSIKATGTASCPTTPKHASWVRAGRR